MCPKHKVMYRFFLEKRQGSTDDKNINKFKFQKIKLAEMFSFPLQLSFWC